MKSYRKGIGKVLGLISDSSLHLKVGEVDRQWKTRVIGERKVEVIVENIALDSVMRGICSSITFNQKNRILTERISIRNLERLLN